MRVRSACPRGTPEDSQNPGWWDARRGLEVLEGWEMSPRCRTPRPTAALDPWRKFTAGLRQLDAFPGGCVGGGVCWGALSWLVLGRWGALLGGAQRAQVLLASGRREVRVARGGPSAAAHFPTPASLHARAPPRSRGGCRVAWGGHRPGPLFPPDYTVRPGAGRQLGGAGPPPPLRSALPLGCGSFPTRHPAPKLAAASVSHGSQAAWEGNDMPRCVCADRQAAHVRFDKLNAFI